MSELKGTIKKIGEIQTFSSGFQKLELVLETEEQYPQLIAIEFVQDKIDLPAAHKVGDSVTVGINIRGREWTAPDGQVKYFNSIVGWKILKGESAAPAPAPATPAATPKSEPVAAPAMFEEEDDDLPF